MVVYLILVFPQAGLASERLELYFLSESLKTRTVALIDEVDYFNKKSRLLGFEGMETDNPLKGTSSVSKAFFPIFEYSNNINAGNLSQTIQIGDFTFVSDEESTAKSGMVVGGGFSLRRKDFYGRGRYFDIGLKASLAGAPQHDWLKVSNQSISLCSKNHVKQWTFFNACLDWGHNKRQFSDTSSSVISTSVTRLFSLQKTFHESEIAIQYLIGEDYEQTQLFSRISSLFPDGYKTKVGLKFGEDINDLIALKYSINFDVSKRFNKKPIELSLSQTVHDGGLFLAMPREDITRRVSLAYPLYKGFKITVGYSDTSSSIDYFSNESPYVYVSLPSWSF